MLCPACFSNRILSKKTLIEGSIMIKYCKCKDCNTDFVKRIKLVSYDRKGKPVNIS